MPLARALRRLSQGDKEYGMIRTGFDEMYDADGQVRPHYRAFARWLAETPDELLALIRSRNASICAVVEALRSSSRVGKRAWCRAA
ncbi:hypothetical protein YA0783_21075 [Pseudomonas corrugata]|jgi:hypothetical protein|uniref:hypothetical protein n=1 Tax=Pseudomonas corrugata TaxID=47879 RepID=UPI0018E65AD7|nr:hypothetical protein [Pseudomonas corrugata]MBI6620799.1 hypothetical protein [Pseudomonas corrugata]MBI6691625.1 hypothetical protein [Pseudomonas corrugata]